MKTREQRVRRLGLGLNSPLNRLLEGGCCLSKSIFTRTTINHVFYVYSHLDALVSARIESHLTSQSIYDAAIDIVVSIIYQYYLSIGYDVNFLP